MNFSIPEFVHPTNRKAEKLAPDMAEKTQLYFFLYFAMTGMHALHMIIGIGILFSWSREPQGRIHCRPRDAHRKFRLVLAFVDIVWIFLFPLLYLINRHPGPLRKEGDTMACPHLPTTNSITRRRRAIHHIVTPKTYLAVYITLLIATGLTTGAAFLDLKEFNPDMALAIACFKGVIVILFFMHVYFSSRLMNSPSAPAFSPSSCSS